MQSVINALNMVLTISWVDDLNQKLKEKGMNSWAIIIGSVAFLALVFAMVKKW